MAKTIHLGYAIGTGEAVSVPVAHMVVTGQTQQSGKTTTLEALVSRGAAQGLRAIAFRTKRGEGSFGMATGSLLRPYFRERADWQFVASLLEASRGERMKFERSWIMKACRGANTLADVQRNVAKLQAGSKRAMDNDMFMMLGAYLDEIVPQLARLPRGGPPHLQRGVNVMDLIPYPVNLQQLVVASTLAWVHQQEEGVVSIVPEAWKYIPQGLNSPVKAAARGIAREGAAIGNLLWMDMQDLAGGDKEFLRGVTVWLLGVQREANEIKRTLANIPEGIKRPRAGEIAQLKIGEFFACWADQAIRTYVQPAWMPEAHAQAIATGTLKISTVTVRSPAPLGKITQPIGFDNQGDEMNADQEAKLDALVDSVTRLVERLDAPPRIVVPDGKPPTAAEVGVPGPVFPMTLGQADGIIDEVIRRIRAGAVGLKVIKQRPELVVEVQVEQVRVDGTTLRGRIAQIIAAGFVDEVRAPLEILNELGRRGGGRGDRANYNRELVWFAETGFLTREDGGFQSVKDMKINIVKK